MSDKQLQLHQTLSRQTSYALLSAVETDFRLIIDDLLQESVDTKTFLGTDIYNRTLSRSQKDAYSDKDKLIEYLDFGDAYQLLNTHKALLEEPLAKILRKVNKKLESLIPVRNRVIHSRPMNFEDYPDIIETSRTLLSHKGDSFSSLRYWYEQIRKDPTSVLNLEVQKYYGDEENSILHNLPMPDFDDTGFLGRSDQTKELKSLIYSNWPDITIVGEGG